MESHNAYFYEHVFPFKDNNMEQILQRAADTDAEFDGSDDDSDGDYHGGSVKMDDHAAQEGGQNYGAADLKEKVVVGSLARISERNRRRPERFAEIDYDELAQATRSSVRVNEIRGKSGDDGGDENMLASNETIDEIHVDQEIEKPQSTSDSTEYNSDYVSHEAQEAHVGWACLCSAGKADDGMFAMLTGEASEVKSDPKSEKEARASSNWDRWRAAQDEEYKALIDESVADVVDRPTDAPVLPSKFVYRTKRNEHGECVRFKARFVPLGCCDPWKALKDTFSPTLRYATLRVLIALAAMLGVVIHQMDVKTAFLNGVLRTPVYVEQPSGYESGDPSKKVWRLKRALYGLVEAPRLWYETLNEALTTSGFVRITGDPCLFVLRRGPQIVVLGVFVDDFLVFGTSEKMVTKVKEMLGSRFKTKDLGHARWVLGMRLLQTATDYTLDQSQYLKDVLHRYQSYIEEGGRRIRLPVAPLPVQMNLRRARDDEPAVEFPYRELLGSIGHLAIGTRIDIAFAVSLLSRFAAQPTQTHWDAGIHVLRYLSAQPGIGLVYQKGPKASRFDPRALGCEPSAAVDSDFSNDPDTSKSVGGMLITIFGTAVSWRSKLLKLVATSTCHAEYIAAFECAKKIVWLRMLLQDIGFHLLGPSVLLEDNAAAKHTAETVGISDANKHIRVKFHWLRQCVNDGTLTLAAVPSKKNPADALTKAPTKETLGVLMAGAKMSSVGQSIRPGRLIADRT